MRELKKGELFGAWEVSKKVDSSIYLCVCTACGETVKRLRAHDLVGGKTRMCRSCSAGAFSKKKPLEYYSWVAMIQRCHNPNCKDYKNYGGRGIKVFDLWRSSFDAFFMMVGPRPDPAYTLERIDTNGNYEPGNVKWASRAEQTRNQRSNVNITIDGETKTVSEWAEDPRCEVTQFTIYKRLKRGWCERDAVLLPNGSKVKK